VTTNPRLILARSRVLQSLCRIVEEASRIAQSSSCVTARGRLFGGESVWPQAGGVIARKDWLFQFAPRVGTRSIGLETQGRVLE
jgi:hypothetical protein